eukprot:65692_1
MQQESKAIPVLSDKFYGNDEYLQVISNTNKNNARWIYSSLIECINDNADDTDVLDSFEPSSTNPSHPYLDDIKEAFSLFKEWEKEDTVWRLNSTIKKDEDSVLSLSMNRNNRITKSEMILPYSTPIIAGIFCNNEHYGGIDESILKSKILNEFDHNSYSVYVMCNQPFPFSSNRDLLMVRFCYVLGNGQFIFGEKSIIDDDFVPAPEWDYDNGTIRADNINLWHIKPVPGQSNHSFIRHYASFEPHGAFSRILQKKLHVDKGKHLVKLYDYMNEIKKILHTEGQLFIPLQLFDLLDINHESLAIEAIGENDEGSDADANILDLNLAVATVICDVKDFFNGIGKPQQKV